MSHLLDRMFMLQQSIHRLPFQQALDAIGASEQAGSDFSLQVLPEDLDRGVQLLANNQLDPYSRRNAMTVLRISSPKVSRPQTASWLPDAAFAAPGSLPRN